MSTKLTKDEAKKPDAFLEKSREAFTWSVQHTKILVTCLTIFVVVGLGYSVYSQISFKKESEAQEKYYKVERAYLDKKAKFDEAEQPTPAKKSGDKSGKEEPKKDVVKATGDLSQDYGDIVNQLKTVIKETQGTKASLMAALTLSEILTQYKMTDQALEVLSQIEPQLGNDLVSNLTRNQLANMYANKNDCNAAIQKWDQIVKNSSADFMHDEVRLRMGICYETMNQTSQAEEQYNQVVKGNPNSMATRTAMKYLKVLNSKKAASGT